MNRGIMVTRCDPDEHELTESARYSGSYYSYTIGTEISQ